MARIFSFMAGLIFVTSLSNCENRVNGNAVNPVITLQENRLKKSLINPQGRTLSTRVSVIEGFEREKYLNTSFASFLQNLPLKPDGSIVKTYDGETKENNGIYIAVVDLPIGNRDLHQCADAVMRLRMDYLYEQERYNEIHFNFTNGYRVDYSEWMKGKRMVVSGNKTYWKQSTSPSNTQKDFVKYKELIYSYAGTLSLSRELNPINISKLQIGDVFIKGGSPGHAVIVVDLAIHSSTGEKLFLLAQSYMPAQEIQILANPMNQAISPWYSTKSLDYLQTPEWEFEIDELMRF